MPFKDKEVKADWQRDYMVRYRKTQRKTPVRPEQGSTEPASLGVANEGTTQQSIVAPTAMPKSFNAPLTKERQVKGFNKR